jgi:F0F1-type ATP synthase membrane subunit b/b'
MSDKTTKSVDGKNIEDLKNKVEEAQRAHKEKLEELKEQMAKLREEAKALKDEEKKRKEKEKKLEAKEKAEKLAKFLKSQENKPKRNLTQEIRDLMVQGKTVDEMVEILNVPRKSILDRKWLIEKSLGLR